MYPNMSIFPAITGQLILIQSTSLTSPPDNKQQGCDNLVTTYKQDGYKDVTTQPKMHQTITQIIMSESDLLGNRLIQADSLCRWSQPCWHIIRWIIDCIMIISLCADQAPPRPLATVDELEETPPTSLEERPPARCNY